MNNRVISLQKQDVYWWRAGINTLAAGLRVKDTTWIEDVTKSLEKEPIRLGFLEEALVA